MLNGAFRNTPPLKNSAGVEYASDIVRLLLNQAALHLNAQMIDHTAIQLRHTVLTVAGADLRGLQSVTLT